MNNYTGCKSNVIPCGGYYYSYAETVEDAEPVEEIETELIEDVSEDELSEYNDEGVE